MKYILLFILIVFSLAIVGCDKGANSTAGFSLPQGSVQQGELVFLKYQCLSCHQMNGIAQDDIIDNPKFAITLGGKKARVKTYAELLTSVINPSHKFARGYRLDQIQSDGVSKMKVYNDVMTVAELIDLVSFLQPKYELIPYKRTNYQYYEN